MPKDKKKSKKERKKELEEKRRQEEELLRQQQEEERKRQEELAQKKREEEAERQRLLKKKRREELVRLDKERQLDVETNAKRESDLRKLQNELSENLAWKKHILCDSLPDASIEKELNDFLTMWMSISLNSNEQCQIQNDEATTTDNSIQSYNEQFECCDTVSYRNVDTSNVIHEIDPVIQDVNFGYKLVPQVKKLIYEAVEMHDFEQFIYGKNRLNLIGKIAMSKLHELTKFLLRSDHFTSVACIKTETTDDNESDITNSGTKDSVDSDLEAKKEFCQYYVSYGLWSSALANAFKNIKIDFPKLKMSVELPKQVPMKAGMPLALNVIQLRYDLDMKIAKKTDNMNQIIYEPIGPILLIYLYELPAPVSSLREWHIQEIGKSYEMPTIWEYAVDTKQDPANPETVTISYHIPNDIAVETNMATSATEKTDETKTESKSEFQLGWWNHETNQWDPSDFKDVKSEFVDCPGKLTNQCRRRITFTTSHIATPLALIKPLKIDFEHKDWKLYPVSVERCKLELIGQRYTFEFEIVDSDVQILQPKLPQISKLLNKLMRPNQLLRFLNECGINLCSQLMHTQTHENEKSN